MPRYYVVVSLFVSFVLAAGCGGGGPLPPPAPPAPIVTSTTIDGNTLITIAAKSNDLVWDPVHGVLYAAISHDSPNYPGTIAAIDPLTGRMNSSVSVSHEAGMLAISDDGQFLYAGMDPKSSEEGFVQRYVLPALTPDIQISLGSRPAYPLEPSLPYYPLALAVAPGSPRSLAVAKGLFQNGPGNFAQHDFAEIYDDQQARPKMISDGYPFESNFLAWGADATTIYVTDPVPQLHVLSADATGLTNISTFVIGFTGGPLFPSLPVRIFFDKTTGYIYTDQGQVVDPANGQRIIRYSFWGNSGDQQPGIFYPDPRLDQVYFVETMSPHVCVWPQCNTLIGTLDKTSGQILRSISFKDFSYPPVVLTRWGSNGLAFTTNNVRLDGVVIDRTNGKIFILQGPLVAP